MRAVSLFVVLAALAAPATSKIAWHVSTYRGRAHTRLNVVWCACGYQAVVSQTAGERLHSEGEKITSQRQKSRRSLFVR